MLSLNGRCFGKQLIRPLDVGQTLLNRQCLCVYATYDSLVKSQTIPWDRN